MKPILDKDDYFAAHEYKKQMAGRVNWKSKNVIIVLSCFLIHIDIHTAIPLGDDLVLMDDFVKKVLGDSDAL